MKLRDAAGPSNSSRAVAQQVELGLVGPEDNPIGTDPVQADGRVVEEIREERCALARRPARPRARARRDSTSASARAGWRAPGARAAPSGCSRSPPPSGFRSRSASPIAPESTRNGIGGTMPGARSAAPPCTIEARQPVVREDEVRATRPARAARNSASVAARASSHCQTLRAQPRGDQAMIGQAVLEVENPDHEGGPGGQVSLRPSSQFLLCGEDLNGSFPGS